MFDLVEEALTKRVQELLPEVKGRVHSLGEILDGDGILNTPAVGIALDGYKPMGAAGEANKIASRWLLSVATSTSRQIGGAKEMRVNALTLAGRLLEGLVGWRPAKGYTPFVVAEPGGPIWIKSRNLYLLPVAVATSHVVVGVQDEY